MSDLSMQYSDGGQYTSTHAAATTGAVCALSAPGRLCRICVLTVGSAVTPIYDSATTATGNVVYTVKASATTGDILNVQLPVATGIYVAGATNTSGIVVAYSKDTAYGR